MSTLPKRARCWLLPSAHTAICCLRFVSSSDGFKRSWPSTNSIRGFMMCGFKGAKPSFNWQRREWDPSVCNLLRWAREARTNALRKRSVPTKPAVRVVPFRILYTGYVLFTAAFSQAWVAYAVPDDAQLESDGER